MVATPPSPATVTLESQLIALCASLRPGQQQLAQWSGGELAVSAVPGAGKSHSMAVAAAIAIARHQLNPRQQLVVVTFTRSAAANIKQKIRQNLQRLSLPAHGFMVQTLHGLALHIATRHPALSGLNLERMTLAAPNRSHRLLRQAVEAWIEAHPEHYGLLLEGLGFDGEEAERLRRHSILRTEILPSLAHTVIHEAKSSGLTAQEVQALSQTTIDPYQTLAIAAQLYADYETQMRSRNWIDYDDMILAALRVLKEPAICQLWQQQIFAVFEDEAQDSSPLQSQLLEILAKSPEQDVTNLVRVGDPNQAINSTFTPADPIYFNAFCDRCAEQQRLTTMAQSGRSHPQIIAAANFVLNWVNQTQNYVEPAFRQQMIQPVASDDPQPDANPDGPGVEIQFPSDVFATAKQLAQRAIALLQDNPGHNAAILVREHRQARFLMTQMAELAKAAEIPLYDVAEAERHAHIPEEMLKLLRFLDRPHSPQNLRAALHVLGQRQQIPTQDIDAIAANPERFLYPTALEGQPKPTVRQACRYCQKLLRAKLELPHYNLIPFLGMSLNYSGSELASVQKLATRIFQETLYQRSLSNMIEVLQSLIQSEQFSGVEEEADERYTKSGQLTIITMHKAKGLDWDYVFIPFLHEDSIPGAAWVPNHSKFLGDFNLDEVARAYIRSAVHAHHLAKDPSIPTASNCGHPQAAWQRAKELKGAEEYRLLYVAMTRAKRLLWLSAAQMGPFRWGVFQGKEGLQNKRVCGALLALSDHL